jgi:hypothetical protein
MGVYLGSSPNHASSVPLVLSTTTGLVSPQFHVVLMITLQPLIASNQMSYLPIGPHFFNLHPTNLAMMTLIPQHLPIHLGFMINLQTLLLLRGRMTIPYSLRGRIITCPLLRGRIINQIPLCLGGMQLIHMLLASSQDTLLKFVPILIYIPMMPFP